MPRVPRPKSQQAEDALQIIGVYWRTGGDKRHFTPLVREAYRTWGKITGTHIRPGHKNGSSARASEFCKRKAPPRGVTLQFETFEAKKAGKSWQQPFLRHSRPGFNIEITVIAQRAHWRVRFPRSSPGPVPSELKRRLMSHLGVENYPSPKGKSLSRWTPAPAKVMALEPGYVAEFVAALCRKKPEAD